MPQRYVDYFELKASETLQAEEKLLSSLNYLEEFTLVALPIIHYQRQTELSDRINF